MTGRRSIVGLALFCAFLFSAFVAQGATAAIRTVDQHNSVCMR